MRKNDMFKHYNFYSPVCEFESFLNTDAIMRVDDSSMYRQVKLRKNEKIYGINNLLKNISKETYLMCDLHIGDPIDNWEAKRDLIVDTINSTVSENDHLLILGDLSAHANTADINDVKAFVNMLNCKNLYLVLGNNDQASIYTYVNMGFKTVTDRFTYKNWVFTHMPVPVYGNQINFHGHIHHEIQYLDVNWQNHINVWDNTYTPIKIKDALERFKSGYYKGVSMTTAERHAQDECTYATEEMYSQVMETSSAVISKYKKKMRMLEKETGETRIARLDINPVDNSSYQSFRKFDKVRNTPDPRQFIDENTYIISDLHFGRYGEEYDNRNINIINKIPSDTTLLILGDVGYVKKPCREYIKQCFNRISVENRFLILGNHDCYELEFYYDDLGFKGVHEYIYMTDKNWVFTHQPADGPEPDMINFHGHIHSETVYYDYLKEIDNKINCWEGYCRNKVKTLAEWYHDNLTHPKKKVLMK